MFSTSWRQFYESSQRTARNRKLLNKRPEHRIYPIFGERRKRSCSTQSLPHKLADNDDMTIQLHEIHTKEHMHTRHQLTIQENWKTLQNVSLPTSPAPTDLIWTFLCLQTWSQWYRLCSPDPLWDTQRASPTPTPTAAFWPPNTKTSDIRYGTFACHFHLAPRHIGHFEAFVDGQLHSLALYRCCQTCTPSPLV